MEIPGLSSLDALTDLGSRGRVDMRPTLLRVLTDLYVQKLSHTPDEERHYTELALRLLEAVDVSTRTAVAARLARHLSPPIRIIQRLANDLPEVVAALAPHPLLQPSRRVDGAPRRAALGTKTATTAPDESETEITRSASAPDTIAVAAAGELNELFFAASAEERRLILRNLDRVVASSAERLPVSRDQALIERLETTALAHNREGFAQHLAALLRIPPAQAQRIVRDELGEPIVIAAKVLGMPRDVLYRILLFINPAVGHSVERVHALAALYDEMTTGAAEDVVAIWQALQGSVRAATRHQPLLWNDDARTRARPAAAAHRPAAVPRTTVRRDVS